MEHMIRSRSLTGYRELVRQLNGKPESLLARFAIDVEHLDQDVMISYVQRTRLLEATAQALSCPDFGLRLAERQNLHTMGPLALLAQNSTTVESGVIAMARYLPYHCTALAIGIDAQTLPECRRVTFSATVPQCPQQRQSVELSVSYIQAALAMLTGGKSKPAQILFRHDANMPLRHYRRWFDCPVHFLQDVNALVLPLAALNQPIDQANPDLLHMAEAYISGIVERQPANVTEQVRALVINLLQTPQCTALYIAQRLNLHKRTLQRRLAAENTTFELVLDNVRRQRAEEFLGQNNLSMVQIAGLLGFVEQSSFNRACKRWFDSTPRKIRATATQ